MQITGNTILITGGGTGIGLVLAELLVEQDNQVIICGRRRSRLLAAKKRIPQLHIRVCDVSRSPSRQALVQWLISEFNNLNLLVNNAGIQRMVDFKKGIGDFSDLNREIATNLTAPIHLSALLIPHLMRQKNAAIVNVSSGLAFTPLAVVPVYCATKSAIHSWSLTLRFQLRDTSVRVFEAIPPTVRTELAGNRPRPTDAEHSMSAEAVAQGIMEGLKQDTYEIILGPATELYKQREALFEIINQ